MSKVTFSVTAEKVDGLYMLQEVGTGEHGELGKFSVSTTIPNGAVMVQFKESGEKWLVDQRSLLEGMVQAISKNVEPSES